MSKKRLYIIEATIKVPFLADVDAHYDDLVLDGLEAVEVDTSETGIKADVVSVKPMKRMNDVSKEFQVLGIYGDDEGRTLRELKDHIEP